jgi:hypothetical protein
VSGIPVCQGSSQSQPRWCGREPLPSVSPLRPTCSPPPSLSPASGLSGIRNEQEAPSGLHPSTTADTPRNILKASRPTVSIVSLKDLQRTTRFLAQNSSTSRMPML